MIGGQYEQYIGIAAGICTGTSLLPQLFKTVKEKCADGISVKMLLVLMTGLILWTWYGILKKDWPIILTNSFSLVVNITLLILKQVYKERG